MELKILYYAGILIITGLLFGKVAKFFRLPNVTGYLVGGLIISSNILNIVDKETAKNLTLISNIALGFIAFSIGNEMKFSYFRQVGARPIIIATFESLFAVLFVLGGLLAYFGFTGNLTTINLQFSLILSAIAAATAPAATLMVVRQYKAKGELTDTLLGVVAIDDGTAIMFFGICVAIANMLGKTSNSSVLMQILDPILEIITSLGTGCLIGLVLVLASKWFTGRGNRICLVVASIFLTSYLADLLGGSSLLACMFLGFTYVNLYRKSDEVNGLLYFVTPPIFVMFFVLSGANLDLKVFTVVGIIGVIYIVLRVVGKIAGAWFGSVITKAEEKVAKYLGFTLIPQAGVAIGLSLIAMQILNEELGSRIQAIVLSATLVYELIGPLVTKTALRKAKEIEANA